MDNTDQIEDHLAIRELTAKYAFFINTFQIEKWISLWCEDGVFDETAVDNGRHVGTQSIKQLMTAFCNLVSHQMHFGGAHIIEFKSTNEATGIYYTIAESVTKEGHAIKLSLYYEDEYVKRGNDWLFKERRVIPLLPYDIAGLKNMGKVE